MKEILDKYIKGEIELTPIMNCIQYDKDTLTRIGKLVLSQFKKGKLPAKIEKYRPLLKNDSNSWIAILFYTSMLDAEVLLTMFGEPVCHNKFGEGLKDVDGVPKQHRRKSYASYFVVVNGTLIHIGYDHRGTTIEVPLDMTPDNAEKILNTLMQKLLNP